MFRNSRSRGKTNKESFTAVSGKIIYGKEKTIPQTQPDSGRSIDDNKQAIA